MKELRGFWLFLLLTYAASWIVWFAAIYLDLSDVPNGILILLGAFMPSLMGACLALYKQDREAKRDFWDRVISFRRIGAGWLLVVFGFFAVNWVVTLTFFWFVEGGLPEFANVVQTLTNPTALIGFTIIQILGGPLAEELGWRGYALDILQSEWTALTASLVLGLFWAVWHFPLFFVKNSSQMAMGFGSAHFWLWTIGTFSTSVFMTWIYNNTNRSILAAILIHLIGNYVSTLVGADIPADKVVFGNSVFTFVSVALVVLILIFYGPKTMTRPLKEKG